ncbi:hypothetical protein, partial [Haloquadratum walsbyi]|uniref:hypothetical protein n=1 Tax=Haloquadratum walsbyi TaxID=293091 RepID=UPI0023F2DF8E
MSVAFPIGGIGIGSAQQRVSISPDFPDRPTAGERTSVSVSIETPDVTPFGSISTDAEINLYVDGSLVNSRSITIGDGEVISSDVGHTFQEGGSKNVRIEVVGSLRNLEFSPSVSGTVDVQPPEIFVDGKPELSRVDLRSSTEVDDSVGVDAEVTAPEFGETDSAQLSASLLVDGEQVSEKPLTDINPEGERSISFNPTFESTGQKNVTLKMTLLLTLAEQTRKLSVSKSTSIDVYKNVSGAMFNTPDSLQEEVTRYRENLSEVALSDLPQETRNDINNTSQFVQNRTNSSVLATENQIYIVLGRQEMDIERVSVRGFVLDKNLTDDITFGVIAATEISDVQPEPVNIQDVTTNSEEYQLDSVQIESHHRRISLRYDPDEAGFAETKLNVGVLTNDPITGSDLFSNLGSRAEAIANDSQDESTTLRPIDYARSPYLRTVSFSTEEQFWIDAPAEVRGLILRSDSPAVNFLQRYYPSQVEYLKDERQILYVTDTNLSPQNVGDIQEINSRADSLNQEVVQTEVNLADGVISTQENIE